ncbi:hypothetical protein Leryth_020676 [Lithospermum erythrorhizon]|nr:hypothetical protein Leryth_020676 [Lithospermum erythrorhizon]
MSGYIRSKSKTPPILCKKHPKHKQSPGVCAICLREKLNQLPSTSSITKKATKKANAAGSSCSSSSLSSLSSHESSNASSSCPSPHHLCHRSYSSMTFLKSGKSLFTNSKSMTAIVIPRHKSRAAMDDQTEKKVGFWSKLLFTSKKRRNKGLMLKDKGDYMN